MYPLESKRRSQIRRCLARFLQTTLSISRDSFLGVCEQNGKHSLYDAPHFRHPSVWHSRGKRDNPKLTLHDLYPRDSNSLCTRSLSGHSSRPGRSHPCTKWCQACPHPLSSPAQSRLSGRPGDTKPGGGHLSSSVHYPYYRRPCTTGVRNKLLEHPSGCTPEL